MSPFLLFEMYTTTTSRDEGTVTMIHLLLWHTCKSTVELLNNELVKNYHLFEGFLIAEVEQYITAWGQKWCPLYRGSRGPDREVPLYMYYMFMSRCKRTIYYQDKYYHKFILVLINFILGWPKLLDQLSNLSY